MNDFVNYMPITIVMIIALISLMVQPLYKAVIKFIAAPIVGAVYVLYIGITTAMERSAAQAVPQNTGGVIIKFNSISEQKTAA